MKQQRLIWLLSFAALLASSVLLCGFLISGGTVRIFLIGDSTMSNKPLTDNPERGWGEIFPMFFDRHVTIENYAVNGRSTKSFIDQGRWQNVLDKLRPNDYVFIQFGHNDEKKEDTSRYAAPGTGYRNNLLKFVHETRSKGALPILLTPVSRRKFDEEKKAAETHQEYSDAVRQVAKEENIPLIDLDEKSTALLEKFGEEKSKSLFLWIPPGIYKTLPEGKQDNTHFTIEGAKTIAGLVVEGIKELHLPLESWLKPTLQLTDVGKGKLVLLDYFFNNERKTDPSNRPMRYHYIWEDTANSGFSQLGETIIDLGADIDSLEVGPTAEKLARASIYMIVDPDIPTENPAPHYIDSSAREAIVEWVRGGGILLLFGNDKGNAEFEHLNMLSERFGIHFNEDSRNRVEGNKFEMGAFDKFPSHPIFEGVNKIYLKEISTLRLSGSAESILTDKGDVIIGYSQFGKGKVVAVGDPWFYNEYFDNRKLPDGFENYKAAENMFRWLLKDAKAVRSNE